MARAKAAGRKWVPKLVQGYSLCMSVLRSCSQRAARWMPTDESAAKLLSDSRLERWAKRWEQLDSGWSATIRRQLLCIRCTCAPARVASRIVNPLDQTITVLVLRGTAYVEHGVFRRGEQTDSVCLPRRVARRGRPCSTRSDTRRRPVRRAAAPRGPAGTAGSARIIRTASRGTGAPIRPGIPGPVEPPRGSSRSSACFSTSSRHAGAPREQVVPQEVLLPLEARGEPGRIVPCRSLGGQVRQGRHEGQLQTQVVVRLAVDRRRPHAEPRVELAHLQGRLLKGELRLAAVDRFPGRGQASRPVRRRAG